MNPHDADYRPGLSGDELVREIQSLVAAERTATRLICRYLADFVDCLEGRSCAALWCYADVYHAARCLFDIGTHTTRERVRVGRALRSLPRIEQALVQGDLSYSRAREVTRVATSEDESAWLDLARTLPIRTLERRVAETSGPARPAKTVEPAIVGWTSPRTVEVRLQLPAETWALLKRAMEGARGANEASLGDAEALGAVARDALEHQSAGGDTSDLRRAVVLYECQSCGRSELDTGAGAIELDGGAVMALGCGAKVTDLRTEGRIVRRGGPLPRAIERAVRQRDRNACRVPGCQRRRYVDVHPIAPRAEGGEHSRGNCCCLCTTHHGLLHDGHLRIEGDADGQLAFHDEAGEASAWPGAAGGASHSGTSVPHGGDAATLLALMGRRGGGSTDALVEASGLGVSAIVVALLGLELDGRVQRDTSHQYGPVHSGA